MMEWVPAGAAISDGTPCELRFDDARGSYRDVGPFFLHDDGHWYRIDPPMQVPVVPTWYRPLSWLLAAGRSASPCARPGRPGSLDGDTMYDILEVLFFHTGTEENGKALAALREVLDSRFEIEAHEFLDAGRQVVRILSSDEAFESAREFEDRLREVADEDAFPWKLIGAVPVGHTDLELA